MADVTVVDHPLVQHKLSIMRRKDTPTAKFRQLLNEISLLLGYEVTHDLAIEMRTITTPLMEMPAPFLSGKKLALISILRAGNGLLEGMLDLVPSARVGHIGLYRDPDTLVAVEYYFKVPDDLEDRPVIMLDPMLATANSAIAAVARIKEAGARHIKMVCLLASPEGVEAFPAGAPGRTDLHCRHRLVSERSRLHRAGTRRCGGSPVRDEVNQGFGRCPRPLPAEVSGTIAAASCAGAVGAGNRLCLGAELLPH